MRRLSEGPESTWSRGLCPGFGGLRRTGPFPMRGPRGREQEVTWFFSQPVHRREHDPGQGGRCREPGPAVRLRARGRNGTRAAAGPAGAQTWPCLDLG